MDNFPEWKAYWGDVIAASFNWAVNIWPIPTVLLGVVIIMITTGVFWKLGRHDEVNNIAIGFFVSLAVSIVAFVLVVILIGPFLHSGRIKVQLAELDELRIEKNNFATTLEGIKSERDDAIKQQKLFEDARDFLQQEVDTSRKQFEEQKTRISGLRTDHQEKLRRKAMRETISSYIKEGEELKLDLTVLKAQGDQWIAKVGAHLATLPDSSFKIQFAHPPIPPSYAYLMNTLYTNPAWIKVEAHLMALRKFLSDLRD